jgi:hypothetical protein
MVTGAGRSARFAEVLQFWKQRAVTAVAEPDPTLPPLKTFIPKHKLPAVSNYKTHASEDFWSSFPSNTTRKGVSPVSAIRLLSWANAVGCDDHRRLLAVCKDLEEGADIGCRGTAREPSFSTNAASSHDFGAEVTDAVASWVQQGIVAGPFKPSEQPRNVKINGVMCRMKPNGTARIILNLSSPRGFSVNDGITADEFPTSMSSTAKWISVLDKAGRGCTMAKVDWAAAYKHIAVRSEDLPLQYFHWLGRDFVELMLVFGGASSAGLYDRLAKTVLDFVIRYSKFPPEMVIQYLDDVCAAAPKDCGSLARFVDAYRKVAADVGVQLAPTTDPEKAFDCATSGVVLGVHYDTVKWIWAIPAEKLARVLSQLRSALSEDSLAQHEMWSLVGRVLHYTPLIPGGRFNIVELIKAGSASTDSRNDSKHQKASLFLVGYVEDNHRPSLHPNSNQATSVDPRILHRCFRGVRTVPRTWYRRHRRQILVLGPVGAQDQFWSAQRQWTATLQETLRSGARGTAHLCCSRSGELSRTTPQSLGRQCRSHRHLEKRIQHAMRALHDIGKRHQQSRHRQRMHNGHRKNHQVLQHRFDPS